MRFAKAYNSNLRRSQRLQHNLFLEAGLLHARVVWEFLFGGKVRTDRSGHELPDVRAFHFFDDSHCWKPDKTKLCPFLAKNLDRLHRSLAHISYDRITYGKNGNPWSIGTVITEIQTAWQYFLGQLADERKRWFDFALEGQQRDDKRWYQSKVMLVI